MKLTIFCVVSKAKTIIIKLNIMNIMFLLSVPIIPELCVAQIWKNINHGKVICIFRVF